MKVKARVLSLVFALVLLAGTALPAFADEAGSTASTASAASDKENDDASSKDGDASSKTGEGDSKPADESSGGDTTEVPDPSKERYYLDLAEVLTAETKATILEKNKALKGEQEIVVVTVNAKEGANSEDLSKRIFAKWEIGGKERANGILLLLDPGNQTYYGLSGAGLSKAFPESVLSNLLATNLEADFNNEKYDAGVRKTFEAFHAKLLTADTEGSSTGESEAKEGGILGALWGFIKILLIIVGIILALALIFVVLVNIRANQRKKRRRNARRGGAQPSGRSRSRTSGRSRTGSSGHSRTDRRSLGSQADRQTADEPVSRQAPDNWEEDDGWQE